MSTPPFLGELANAIKDLINNLLSSGVVTTGVVVSSVLLAVDDLLRMVELTVRTGSNLVAHSGFEIDVDGARDVLPSRCLAEEGVERIISFAEARVRVLEVKRAVVRCTRGCKKPVPPPRSLQW